MLIHCHCQCDLSQAWTRADNVRLLWFIQTYRDLNRLRATLKRLHELYSDSTVVVVSDGDPDPAIEKSCCRYSARYVMRPRLFGVEHGGEPVQRMLEAFLPTHADILIKIDPDTDVRRRFRQMPSPEDVSVYGSVQSSGDSDGDLTSIQGGCIIIPRAAGARLAHSAILGSRRLKPPALEWAVHDRLVARAAAGLTSYDWTLGWACRELGLECRDHPEVFSRYHPWVIDTIKERAAPFRSFAVCHPRFEIRQTASPAFYFRWLNAWREPEQKMYQA